MDERTAAVQLWAAQEAQQSKTLTERTVAGLWLLWRSLSLADWYRATPAARSAQMVEAARKVSAGLGAAYTRRLLVSTSATPIALPQAVTVPAARNGRDLAVVYDRPGEAYRRKYSTTGDPIAALRAAEQRLEQLIDMDLHVARRDAELQVLRDYDVQGTSRNVPDERKVRILGYRRVVHPELSETGVCGLCLAASDRLYTLEELMPLHDRCRCAVAAVTEDYDPADSNEVDLEAIYAAAGGTTDGRALKKVRYQVRDHGELGPLLVVEGQRFQREGEAPAGDPRERAAAELAALEPVLVDLERRQATGADVDAPLTWQRDRVAKLRAIAGDLAA